MSIQDQDHRLIQDQDYHLTNGKGLQNEWSDFHFWDLAFNTHFNLFYDNVLFPVTLLQCHKIVVNSKSHRRFWTSWNEDFFPLSWCFIRNYSVWPGFYIVSGQKCKGSEFTFLRLYRVSYTETDRHTCRKRLSLPVFISPSVFPLPLWVI